MSNHVCKHNYFNNIPTEIIILILNYLDCNSLIILYNIIPIIKEIIDDLPFNIVLSLLELVDNDSLFKLYNTIPKFKITIDNLQKNKTLHLLKNSHISIGIFNLEIKKPNIYKYKTLEGDKYFTEIISLNNIDKYNNDKYSKFKWIVIEFIEKYNSIYSY